MKSHVTIDQALQDQALLGAALGPTGTWSTWLTTLKAAFGLTLNRAERHTFEAIAGSRQPPKHKVSQLWAILGRGSGKSRMAAAIAVYVGAFLQHDLDPGETGYVLVLAGSRDQASMVFAYALAFLRNSPILRSMIASTTAHEIRLTNNVTIAVHSNSFRLVRGKTLLATIFDEVAYWRDDSSANPDIETYRAVRPSLARTDGLLVGISSPYRRVGLLYQKFKDSYDTDDDAVLVVKGPTAAFNPTIDAGVIAKEMLADPESARSEWGAEFRTDVSALFDEGAIADAVDHARPLELPPRYGRRYGAFTDASAGRNDAFAICIAHVEGLREDARWFCDVVRGRPAPFNPRDVADEYAKLAWQYGCPKIVGDAYAGNWVADAFADAGIKYETSPLPKSQLYLEALPHFNRGAVSLPAHDKLLRELRSLERRVHRSGKDSVDHPRAGSDDLANAVCGALYIGMSELRRPRARFGAIAFGTTGKVSWKDEEDERPRLRIISVSEAEAIKMKEAGEW